MTLLTVTAVVTLYPLYVAVMVAVPAATPVIFPPDMVATEGLLEVHAAYDVTSVSVSLTPSTVL